MLQIAFSFQVALSLSCCCVGHLAKASRKSMRPIVDIRELTIPSSIHSSYPRPALIEVTHCHPGYEGKGKRRMMLCSHS